MNMLQFSLHMKSCILIFFNRESHCNWLTTRVFYKKKTKQAQHDCLLLRNLAMLGASEDLQDRPVHSTPDRLLSCPHCARTFLTQNGLQMHLQKTHAVDCKGSIYPVQQPAHIVVKHSSAVERHIRGGKCVEFHPDLPVCTLLSSHDRLRELVTNDKLDEIKPYVSSYT